MRLTLALILTFLVPPAILAADEPKPLPTIEERSEGLTAQRGFLDLYWDESAGAVLMRIDRFQDPVLYVTALTAGVGSNDLGLDRGQLGRTTLVEFLRVGRRVLMIEPNLRYRADSDNSAELRAVQEAFASSALAALEVVAADDDGAVLVDVTELVTSDAHEVADRLKQREQGKFSRDPERSLPLPDRIRAFPKNVVVDALVTFSGEEPGAQVRSVTPSPRSLTVRMQHQFVAPPEDGFERRPYHPRSGYFPFVYRDYAAPLGESIDRRVLVRHRIERDAEGRPEPLVYYVDRGAPEPVRSALLEGASWWSEAFAAAGLPGVFQVQVLPEGVDPLDIRYNVIQWVHRSTRGWSYGASVVDPRSGEIVKGHISLGSLRVRQDMLIAEALTAPFATGDEEAGAIRDMALARLRQLSAHEVGHTLGLAHNFAASVSEDASVMDYPHPKVGLDETGRVRIDDAYDTGIGEWDRLAIAYGYREYPDTAARDRGLARILADAREQGLRFISDPDARGFGTPHAVAHLWDNGAEPLQRFRELSAVRRAALAGFGETVLRHGVPQSELERKLVPAYLVHRYQAEAVAKLLGGLDYDYAVRGDQTEHPSVVAPQRQRAALDALLEALAPGELALPDGLASRLPPPAYGFARDREYFSHRSGAAFDAFAPARALAQLLGQLLLDPERAQRLVNQHAADEAMPGLGELLERLLEDRVATVLADDDSPVVAQEAAWVLLREAQRLAVAPEASDLVRSRVRLALADTADRLGRGAPLVARELRRFLERPEQVTLPERITVPPGSPI